MTNAEIEIKDYKLTRLGRIGKTGGDVCVYTRSSIKARCLKDITETSELGFHQLWIQIQLRNLRSILVCVTYRPDYCPTSICFDRFMENYTHALTLGKALLNFCASVNLAQLIKEPTRVTGNSASLIDVIMTSNVNLVENHGVVSSHISDHYLTYVSVKLILHMYKILQEL